MQCFEVVVSFVLVLNIISLFVYVERWKVDLCETMPNFQERACVTDIVYTMFLCHRIHWSYTCTNSTHNPWRHHWGSKLSLALLCNNMRLMCLEIVCTETLPSDICIVWKQYYYDICVRSQMLCRGSEYNDSYVRNVYARVCIVQPLCSPRGKQILGNHSYPQFICHNDS